MATIVGGITSSHIPAVGIATTRRLFDDPYWKPFFDGYIAIREWMNEIKPDVIVSVYNDHGLNFFLDQIPTFAIGAAKTYDNADEGWGLKTMPPVPGDPELSWHIIENLNKDEVTLLLGSLYEDQKALVGLTNSLLLMSRFGKMINRAAFPLVRIDEVIFFKIDIIKRVHPNYKIIFDYEKPPEDEESLCIHADEVLIRPALGNLIRNGCLYSDNYTTLIKLYTGSDFVKLLFENTGPTLQKEDVSRLFIPFFRASNSQTKKGHGLGLTMSKRIIEAHGGTLKYNISPEGKNQFWVNFPKDPEGVKSAGS